jgi:cytochrome P450
LLHHLQAMTAATQDMLARMWRQDGRRDVYADFNDLTLRITVGALFGATVDSRQARRVSGEALVHSFLRPHQL